MGVLEKQVASSGAKAGAVFALVGGERVLAVRGCAERIDGVAIDRAAAEVSARLAAGGPGLAMVVGVLPFDRARPVSLYRPMARDEAFRLKTAYAAPRSGKPEIAAEPSAAVYADSVGKALAAIRAGSLRKVVLSRSLVVKQPGGFDVNALLARLATDHGVTTFCVPLNERTLIGATPELLVAKTGARVLSRPLAGSAVRHADTGADRDAGSALLSSEKDLREHAAVVEEVGDILAPYCSSLTVPKTPELMATATVWHLGTSIQGVLKDSETPSLELAARLHPTPAVCGLPRDEAAALIRDLETYDRGFYAGALGWTDSSGDGEWYVTIRCAEISGDRARLYSGAGIVEGSTPEGEVAETSAKFRALLDALAIENPGAAV